MVRIEPTNPSVSSRSADYLRRSAQVAVVLTLVVGLIAVQGVGIAASDGGLNSDNNNKVGGEKTSPFGECGFLNWLLDHLGLVDGECVDPEDNTGGQIGP
jgi:hypothetical protein